MTPKKCFGAVLVIAAALLLAAGCSKQSKLERTLAQGDKAFAAGDYDKAEEAYMTAILMVSDDPNALGRLGILCYHQGRLVQAYTFLEQALKELPENLDFRLFFGLASYTMGQTPDARKAARKVLETRPADEMALLLLADTCVTTRDNEEAKRIITELRAKNSDAPGYHLALGALHRAQKDFTTAEAELRVALQLDPKSSAAHDQLSNVFAARGQEKEAADALKKAAELAPLRSPVRLKYINHLVRAGQRDAAKTALATIITQAPDCIPALTYDMKLAFEDRSLDHSAATANKILDRDRSNHDALLQLAAIKLVKGDFAGAISGLERAEGFYTRAPHIKYQLALAHLKQGEISQAEDNLRKALQLSPNYDEATVLLAELHIQKGTPGDAVSILVPLVKQRPIRRAIVLLAQAYRNHGAESEALAVLQSLVRSAPKDPDNHYLLGVANLARDREQARQAFEATVELDEQHWGAQEMLINDDLVEKRLAEATARAESLVAKYPGQTAPWLFRAKIRLFKQELENAESDLLQVLKLDPSVQKAYLTLAKIYHQKSRSEEAVATLAASVAKAKSAGLYTQLGMLQYSLERFDAARDAYEKALELNPNFVPALNNLAALYSGKFGEHEKAAKLARSAQSQAPNDPHVADTLGWIFFQQGQYASALPLLQAGATKLPGEPGVLHHLALTHYFLGQEEPARQSLQRLLAAGTDAALQADANNCLAILSIDPATADASARELLSARVAREPNDGIALARLGLIEARTGDAKTAAERLEAAAKLNPRDARTLVALVELYMGPLAKPERGRELASKARTAEPHDGKIAWRLGTLVHGSGDYVWASSLLQDAARALPKEAALHFDLAKALYQTGRTSEAETALQAALELEPPAPLREAVNRMTAMLGAIKDPAAIDRALADATRILAEDPNYTPALMVTAADLERKSDYRGAAKIYDAILARNAGFAPAIRQLALLYADQLGDDAKAEELAIKARQVYGDDPDLASALGSVNYRKADYTSAVRFLRQSLTKRDNHAQTVFLLGMSLFHLKNAPESRAHLQRALQLKLQPQEATEAERVLQQINRNPMRG